MKKSKIIILIIISIIIFGGLFVLGWALKDGWLDFDNDKEVVNNTNEEYKKENKMIKIILEDGRSIKVELYREVAPITVDHFLKLVDNKQFDNVIFHRVIENFMIQTGELVIDRSSNSLDYAKETDTIKGEFSSNGVENNLKHEPGVISMARTNDPNSASNQFFICSATSPHLDGNYAAFGKVADQESLDVVMDISRVRTGKFYQYDDFPTELIVIKTITRC